MTETTVRMRGDVAVLAINGRLGPNDEDDVPTLIAGLMDQGCLKFLLDLGRLRYIDSSGVARIVKARTVVTQKGGALKLFSMSPRIRDLFDMTRLSTVFEILDSEEEALRSFI